MNARETLKARAAQKVEQERLHGVVAMVGHTDSRGVDVTQKLREIAVAELACRHLNADVVQLCMLLGVEVYAVERYVVALAQVDAEFFIAHRLVAAQVEVAVCGLNVESHLFHDKQEGYAVGTTRQGNEIAPLRSEELVCGGIIADGL